VDIATLLTDHLLTAFTVAVGSRHSVRTTRTIVELDTVLRVYPIDVAVIDPLAARVGQGGMLELLPVLTRNATVPVIAYTTVSPDAVRACARLAAHGVRHVVLRGYDDDPASFRALLDSVQGDALADAVLALLEPTLAEISAPVATAIESLFHAPHTVADVDALARIAGTPRRTLDRVLARAGLVPGWTLIRAARVVRAYHYLRGTAARVKDAAAKLGYVRPEQLAEDVTLITGFLPSSLPEALEPDDFVARIAARLRRTDESTRTEVVRPDITRADAEGDGPDATPAPSRSPESAADVVPRRTGS
jgi:AraC-like DNA-binding protein